MKKWSILLLIVAVPATRLLAQENATAELTSELDTYRAKHIQEKILSIRIRSFTWPARSAGLNYTS